MPMFNFKKQFADSVESGEKRQTIRARRKNRPQVGQTAYLYTGARTKACRKLGECVIRATSFPDIGAGCAISTVKNLSRISKRG